MTNEKKQSKLTTELDRALAGMAHTSRMNDPRAQELKELNEELKAMPAENMEDKGLLSSVWETLTGLLKWAWGVFRGVFVWIVSVLKSALAFVESCLHGLVACFSV